MILGSEGICFWNIYIFPIQKFKKKNNKILIKKPNFFSHQILLFFIFCLETFPSNTNLPGLLLCHLKNRFKTYNTRSQFITQPVCTCKYFFLSTSKIRFLFVLVFFKSEKNIWRLLYIPLISNFFLEPKYSLHVYKYYGVQLACSKWHKIYINFS